MCPSALSWKGLSWLEMSSEWLNSGMVSRQDSSVQFGGPVEDLVKALHQPVIADVFLFQTQSWANAVVA